MTNASSSTPQQTHYQILGVPANASDEDIRRAFRRRALQVHPDRAGSSSTAEFQRVNKAYEVLSDPRTRRAYDRYGDRGIELLEGDYNATAMLNRLGAKVMMASSSALMLFFLSCVIAAMATVSTKVDKVMDWRWSVALWPVWLCDMVALTVAVFISVSVLRRYGVAPTPSTDAASRGDVIQTLLGSAALVLYVATTVLVCVRLEVPSAINTLVVVAPALLCELIVAFASSQRVLSFERTKERLTAATDVEPSFCCVVVVVVHNFVQCWERLVFLILIAVRIDGYVNGMHYILTCVAQLLAVPTALASSIAMVSLRIRSKEVTCGQAVMGVVVEAARHALVVAGLVLVSIKAESGGDEPASLALCLVPFFLLGAAVWVMALFVACTMAASAHDDLNEMEQWDHAPPHPTASTTPHAGSARPPSTSGGNGGAIVSV